MTTHAVIGRRLPDSSIRCIQVGRDGYIDAPGAGSILLSYYPNSTAVDQLLDQGDILDLRPTIAETSTYQHALGRSQDETRAGIVASVEELLRWCGGATYCYLLEDNETWLVWERATIFEEWPEHPRSLAIREKPILRRVSREAVLQALRSGAWTGYLAGVRIVPEKVPEFGSGVSVRSVAELNAAREQVLLGCDPDTGFRIAYYVEVT